MAGKTCRVRLGIVLVVLGGLLGVTALSHSLSPAGDSSFQPKIAAFFKENDKLQVAVFLENKSEQVLKGNLQVNLVGEAGAQITSHVRQIRQEEPLGRLLFEIPATKAEADKWTLQVTFQGKRHDVK